MGRASNRKWAKRVARVLELRGSKLPGNQREAGRLAKVFGTARAFLRALAEFSRQVQSRARVTT